MKVSAPVNVFDLLSGPQLAIGMLVLGTALVALAFALKPRPAITADEPAAEEAYAAESRILSQVGFAEVDGRVVPFRSIVRQGEDLTDQQLAAFQSHLLTPAPRPSSYAA